MYAGQPERSRPRAWVVLLLSSGSDSPAQYFKGLGGSKAGNVGGCACVPEKSLEINSIFK